VLTCGVKEGIKAVLLLRSHGSSVAQSYGHFKLLVRMKS
jgi:hypothetical protein